MGNPYPGYPPSFKVISKVGDYSRTCLVIELLSLGEIDNTQLAYIKERLEATIHNLRLSNIEKFEIALPDQFDRVVRDGLRLP